MTFTVQGRERGSFLHNSLQANQKSELKTLNPICMHLLCTITFNYRAKSKRMFWA